MECKLINGLLLGRSIEVTVETLLKVICSHKICNSGQATLSDGLCHGYLGRFSLRGSLAGGGHTPPPSGLQLWNSHLSPRHKGCLDPQGTATRQPRERGGASVEMTVLAEPDL